MARLPSTGQPGHGSEYTGQMGPAGVPRDRPRAALSASDQARLARLTGTQDPNAEVSERVWNGEAIEKTPRQEASERR